MNNERIKLGEWFFGDRLRSEKDPVKSQDLLVGGNNNDQLRGDEGNDTLIGGAGKDRFILQQQTGTDQIQDYEDNIDKFVLTDGLNFADIQLVQGIDSISINIQDTNEVLAVINDVGIDSLDIDDFIASI